MGVEVTQTLNVPLGEGFVGVEVTQTLNVPLGGGVGGSCGNPNTYCPTRGRGWWELR